MADRDSKGRFLKGHKIPKNWKESVRKAQLNKISHRKGITFVQEYGEDRAVEIKIKISIKKRGQHPSTEFKKGHNMNLGRKRPDITGKNNHFYGKHLIPWNKNILLDENMKRKMSATKQGIKLEDWKKYISFEPYDKSFNNSFKQLIRERDNQICMLCEIHEEKLKRALDVHHINYDKLISIPQNCISLCRGCHSKTHTNRKHWTKFFQDLLSEKYGYQYSENKIVMEIKNEKNIF